MLYLMQTEIPYRPSLSYGNNLDFIREKFGSNLCRSTSYPNKYLWFPLAPQEKCQDNTSTRPRTLF
jgi:hypothetical protein